MDIKKYKITNVQNRDEWESKYGMMMDYAIALEGEDGWVKLTQKIDSRPPQIGYELEGYIFDQPNKDGSTQRKFKKANPKYEADRSTNQASSSGSRESYIVQMLEELTGRRDVVDRVADVPDEPLQDPFAGLNI